MPPIRNEFSGYVNDLVQTVAAVDGGVGSAKVADHAVAMGSTALASQCFGRRDTESLLVEAGEPAEMRKSPSLGDLRHRGLAWAAQRQLLVNAMEPTVAKIRAGGRAYVSAKSILKGSHADAHCSGKFGNC